MKDVKQIDVIPKDINLCEHNYKEKVYKVITSILNKETKTAIDTIFKTRKNIGSERSPSVPLENTNEDPICSKQQLEQNNDSPHGNVTLISKNHNLNNSVMIISPRQPVHAKNTCFDNGQLPGTESWKKDEDGKSTVNDVSTSCERSIDIDNIQSEITDDNNFTRLRWTDLTNEQAMHILKVFNITSGNKKMNKNTARSKLLKASTFLSYFPTTSPKLEQDLTFLYHKTCPTKCCKIEHRKYQETGFPIDFDSSLNCGSCYQTLSDDDGIYDCIKCDGHCTFWHHRVCVGLSSAYLNTISNMNTEWLCSNCKDKNSSSTRYNNQQTCPVTPNLVNCNSVPHSDLPTEEQSIINHNIQKETITETHLIKLTSEFSTTPEISNMVSVGIVNTYNKSSVRHKTGTTSILQHHESRDATNKNDLQETTSNNNLCGLCENNTSSITSLCCKGPCSTWFHTSCLNSSNEDHQLNDSLKWICPNCPKPRSLPDFTKANNLDAASWGTLKGLDIKETFDSAYNEIVTWRKNLFKVPSGKNGKAFIAEVKNLITMYTISSPLETVAMTALMVICPLLLQKPTRKSKAKDHDRFLESRLQRWRDGDISSLIKEGRAIQNRFCSSKSTKQDKEKIFARLMLQGKVAAALRWITDSRGSLLKATPHVIESLTSKHPSASPIQEDMLLNGPIYQVDNVIFENIDAQAIYNAAKNTNGAAGPSGMDSDGWQRILCSKSFKSSSVELCEAVAQLAKKLATNLVDPSTLSEYTACRLIPLDKNPGVRPIGIGEVLRRVIGKAITTLLKPEILSTTAPLQACAGLQGGVEASIHALRSIFEDTDSHGILLVDADNAYNALNRSMALQNIRVSCPEFAVYLINTYRQPAKLFIPETGGTYILSREGTTQGDNCASGLYACSCMPLMTLLSSTLETPDIPTTVPYAKQIWFADDSAAGGTLNSIEKWWTDLKTLGPAFGYYPKGSKTWLIVKEQHHEAAKVMFKDIKITTIGHRYLGSYIGSEEGKKQFMNEKAKEWVNEIEQLASIAKKEPQLAYSAFIFGTSKRWSYLMRTTPGIVDTLEHVEHAIRNKLIPSITGRICTDTERELFGLPARYGGLSIINPTEIAEQEYKNSTKATNSLCQDMIEQHIKLTVDSEDQRRIKYEITHEKNTRYIEKQKLLKMALPPKTSRQVDLASEKGSSSWLTTLPLEEYGFTLNKREFQDAISLRYGFSISQIAKVCVCGEENSINHCLICKRGGFVSLRHNSLRDTTANMLSQVCKDVVTEPPLIPLTGESFPASSNTADDARLDISARSFWMPLGRAFFDIRVLHPGAPTNASRDIPQMYSHHESEKKRKYNIRVIEVEKGTFTPLVFSTTGGMGKETTTFIKRLSVLMANKTNQSYNDTVTYIRRRLRFDLLKTALIALRGYRGKSHCAPSEVQDLDINLERIVGAD